MARKNRTPEERARLHRGITETVQSNTGTATIS